PKRKSEADVPSPEKKQQCQEIKSKVIQEKALSIAEKKLADRERSLTNADEEEREKTLAKKKLKMKNPNVDDDDGVKPPAIKRKVNHAEERVKNKRTVFVGNLPADFTKQARAEASLSRKVATIHRKVHPKRKNINAYVVYKDEDSAAKSLKRNGAEVSGFHIRVDIASGNSSHDNKRSAFVGNLPYDIEEESVRNHFIQCGDVKSVRIIRDRNTGIGKGFGYILFQNADSIVLALKLNNSELMGRKIRVKHSVTAETLAKSANKSPAFKHRLNTLNQAKPQNSKTFVGENAESTKVKKKGNKKFKQTVGNKKKKMKG
ncbi:hypothetical protein GDO86_019072, partial [Hymenochirus boettgeri]